MSRPFAFVTLALTAMMAFMIGLIVAGSVAPAPAVSQPQTATAKAPSVVLASAAPTRQAAGLENFADVAERINPAVVNIEATTRANDSARRRRPSSDPAPFDEGAPLPQSSVRPQSGSGFVIERNGQILTNYHVIQSAERIMVKFSDGRNLIAHPLGVDPDTDI